MVGNMPDKRMAIDGEHGLVPAQPRAFPSGQDDTGDLHYIKPFCSVFLFLFRGYVIIDIRHRQKE
ncbi:hypothetical protein SDC9_205243 [bioreactor metagenome]|uniref:Uncharacterized protein n=1 Tax=bioreactor metagenome TaxID=1076179 RepID=A0A645J4D1_9ZZZZ